ncbi:MAG: 50S ribosomal protein L2 [Euryarchaeota archaeon]|nr:50S ribosomal protein L2 [Euryarchaeota archaeon]
MGKRIISQRRGRGTHTYRAPSHHFKADIQHPSARELQGTVVRLLHDPARTSPIAEVRLSTGKSLYTLAPEGLQVGARLAWGSEVPLESGNTLSLSQIPEGTSMFNVELYPGDGGRFARAGGTHALLVSHEGSRAAVQLPSKVIRWLDGRCRATLGVVAGGGRLEKPLLKAGNAYYKANAKARKWPRVRGIAGNPVDHPFGGGRHQHTGKPKTVGRGAPPGRKVGSIAARRTGRK